MNRHITRALIAALALSVTVGAFAEGWTCPSCETAAEDNYCYNCGFRRPDDGIERWSCAECGNEAKGNFCSKCGAAKPSEVPKPGSVMPTFAEVEGAAYDSAAPDFRQTMDYLLKPLNATGLSAIEPAGDSLYNAVAADGCALSLKLVRDNDGVSLQYTKADADAQAVGDVVEADIDCNDGAFVNAVNYLLTGIGKRSMVISPLYKDSDLFNIMTTDGSVYLLTVACTETTLLYEIAEV